MTTMVDTIVSGLDTNWDAGIIAKPSILSKFINREGGWFQDIQSIAIDSVLVEQHQDRVNEITGIDGAGTYYTQARWEIKIIIHTPGNQVAADGIEKEDRLKALHDAVEDSLSDMSGSGYLYRIMRTQDKTPKGVTNKWMMWIFVEVTTPASSATLSGSGHALDSHSDVSAITETKGQIIIYNTSWGALGIGSAGQVLTVTSGLPAWEDSVAGSDVFKTITGITNDVVADSATDTLTLASVDAKLTIVGTTATDTITFSVIEAQIDHDALTNFVAGEHILEANLDHDALTNFVAGEHVLEANLDHDALTNFVAAEHVVEGSLNHDNLTNTHNLTTDVDHDATTNFVANEHIDHTSVTLTAGTGLTGGGDISASRSFALTTTAMTLNHPVTWGMPWLDGSNNDVDMVWDYDNTNHHASVKCTVNNADDSGHWVWRIVLPSDFSSWQTNAIKYWNYVSDTTNAGTTITVSDTTDTFTDGRQQNASWTQTTVTAADLSGASVAASAGSTLIIKVELDGDVADICYVGSVDLFYNRT